MPLWKKRRCATDNFWAVYGPGQNLNPWALVAFWTTKLDWTRPRRTPQPWICVTWGRKDDLSGRTWIWVFGCPVTRKCWTKIVTKLHFGAFLALWFWEIGTNKFKPQLWPGFFNYLTRGDPLSSRGLKGEGPLQAFGLRGVTVTRFSGTRRPKTAPTMPF